ncbi:ankyrin repeat protein [Chaetomium sp. MPI-CAGE-AT-0009]|nr:ankyrin repeat protein [Chaetomium sp. MPI-CAGE-AT-0009]
MDLCEAVSEGSVDRVEMLLNQFVDVNDRNGEGRTPLSLAAENGHDAIVKLLVGKDSVKPDTPDNDGRTPLSWAAGNGHDAVVGVLLGNNSVKPDTPDKLGRTPLS